MVDKPWGGYKILEANAGYWVKKLVVAPGCRLSLQKHEHRAEVWVCIKGEGVAQVIDYPRTLRNGDKHYISPGMRVEVPQKAVHRLSNTGHDYLVVLEIALGSPLDEEDIIRYQDDYGRKVELLEVE